MGYLLIKQLHIKWCVQKCKILPRNVPLRAAKITRKMHRLWQGLQTRKGSFLPCKGKWPVKSSMSKNLDNNYKSTLINAQYNFIVMTDFVVYKYQRDV